MSKPKRLVACVFVNPAGVGKREICFDRKTKKVTSNRAEIVAKSGRTRACAPFRVGQIVSGAPRWDASAVTRFRVESASGKTVLLKHVSGHSVPSGSTFRAKVGCSGGQSDAYIAKARLYLR